jgi:Flp pilus assembly protein TadG
MTTSPRKSRDRRAAVAVEAAIVLPVLLIMMLGIWEVGRIIQVQQILVNSAREGARLAAGGYVNSTPVTSTMVETTVRDYLRSAGLPTAAVNNAQITLACQVSPGWTNPSDAMPLDPFRVTVQIPAGAAFDSLRWSFVTKITNKSDMEAYVDWVSLNNVAISVDTQLPQ